ncbi:hypothetical protein DSM3645_15495 [Blastopirellula marina DSM 3645]|uniref:Lipoprotein n=2 Tax=Blastopirellula marina TaxID=124 RepID=A3ZZ81_9BACT|nr:hypothetical protein DSM3645_15495 [Blastopirellula marina DSM 3645]
MRRRLPPSRPALQIRPGPLATRIKKVEMMKRIALLAAVTAMAVGSVGCHQIGANPCRNPTSVSAPPAAGGGYGGGGAGGYSPEVTYPYYTTRGPRDFLNPHPYDIGY